MFEVISTVKLGCLSSDFDKTVLEVSQYITNENDN